MTHGQANRTLDGQPPGRTTRWGEMAAVRVTPFVGLLVGVTLLAAGLLVATTAVAQEGQQRRTLQRDAAQVSASFSAYLDRARSLDLVLAQDRAFAPSEQGSIDVGRANRALGYLEVLYPA